MSPPEDQGSSTGADGDWRRNLSMNLAKFGFVSSGPRAISDSSSEVSDATNVLALEVKDSLYDCMN